ncbi:MAG TPA: type II secretion system minor pseudopilin GspK [Thermodesulfovibrionales bacterium]|nr:type II secretion system minor pseudopilin GspK [Thermodesulfovibrionales bacterium]
MLIRSEKGIALVLTLMILTIITAVVVEFAYGVYTSTSALYNWRDSQRLSFVAKSGVAVAASTISDPSRFGMSPKDLYKYLGRQIPLENVSEGFSGRVIISAEDENGKFNLNSIVRVWPDGSQRAFDSFRQLLGNLRLDESIAARVADWIDMDSNPRLTDSEEGAKNAYMDSVDELLLIRGVERETYEKLLPYVTVYGYGGTDDPRVNVNTASIPVIMTLAGIFKESAETLVNQRELKPFNSPGEAANIGINLPTSFFLAETPRNFRITAVGEENKIRRVIESVINTGAGSQVKYWREI